MKQQIILSALLLFSLAGCSKVNRVNVEGSCPGHYDGTFIELCCIHDDSLVVIQRDSLVDGCFRFDMDESYDKAYYVSIIDSVNPAKGIFFAEKGTVKIVFDSTYHVSGTPMNDLYNSLRHHSFRGCDHIRVDDLTAIGRTILQRFQHKASLLCL